MYLLPDSYRVILAEPYSIPTLIIFCVVEISLSFVCIILYLKTAENNLYLRYR